MIAVALIFWFATIKTEFMMVTKTEQNWLDVAARDEAYRHRDDHEYLPQYAEDAVDWEPHEWVREAMRRAYNMGLVVGKSEEVIVDENQSDDWRNFSRELRPYHQCQWPLTQDEKNGIGV